MQPAPAPCLSPQDPSPGLEPLLHDYLHARCDLFTLARRHALTLDRLLDTLDSAPFQALLRKAEEAAQRRARAMLLQARPLALERLVQLLETPNAPPPETRRAATTLLREAARLTPTHTPKEAEPGEAQQTKAEPTKGHETHGSHQADEALYHPKERIRPSPLLLRGQQNEPRVPPAGPPFPRPADERQMRSEVDDRAPTHPAAREHRA